MMIAVFDGRRIVLDHFADDAVFVPQRNQDRDRRLRLRAELFLSGKGRLPTPPNPMVNTDQIEQKIVGSAQQSPGSQRNQNDAKNVVDSIYEVLVKVCHLKRRWFGSSLFLT